MDNEVGLKRIKRSLPSAVNNGSRERKVRTPQDRVAANGGPESSGERATEKIPPREITFCAGRDDTRIKLRFLVFRCRLGVIYFMG